MGNELIVVKVGGSLFDWPALRPTLRQWLSQFQNDNVLLVAGGGHLAEAIRTYDRVHQLGEEMSHWLAIQSLTVASRMLESFVAGMTNVTVLDVVTFCESDNQLPHSWAVTSDSIAARVADVRQATRLILLKSVDSTTNGSWNELAQAGIVDDYFAIVASRLSCPIDLINLRAGKLE